MVRVGEIWERDGERCVWCGARPWERDRTVEHLLPRSRGGSSGPHNLLPACRPCNRARGSQSVAAYASRRAGPGRHVLTDLLLRGLDRLRDDGNQAERCYGARQGQAVRARRSSEQALAAHAERLG